MAFHRRQQPSHNLQIVPLASAFVQHDPSASSRIQCRLKHPPELMNEKVLITVRRQTFIHAPCRVGVSIEFLFKSIKLSYRFSFISRRRMQLDVKNVDA